MIDAPANYSGMLIHPNNHSRSNGNVNTSTGTNSGMDRGYDFCGVVKWYADRADVVLLFFDPDKPGTTGETLSILVNALSNIDHKLIIIFNKADQFQNQQIHDFARAYGSLCWNLSKVIPRKDLPRIYTMCLPVELTTPSTTSPTGPSSSTSSTVNSHSISPGLQDLYNAREEVVAQVRKAPERRLDNVITNLYDSVSQLYMYTKIVQDIQSRYYQYYWSCKYQEVFIAGTGIAGTMGCFMYGIPVWGLPWYSTGMIASMTLCSTMGVYYYNAYLLRWWEYQNCTSYELYNTFTHLYANEIQNGNEHIAHVWTQIRDHLSMTLQPPVPPTSSSSQPNSGRRNHSTNFTSTMGGNSSATSTLRKLDIIQERDVQQLHTILYDEIPKLRRYVATTYTSTDAFLTKTNSSLRLDVDPQK
jgi:hypothetical protein